jgi:hypothetical protein
MALSAYGKLKGGKLDKLIAPLRAQHGLQPALRLHSLRPIT